MLLTHGSKMRRYIRKLINLFRRFKDYIGIKILSGEEGNNLIGQLLLKDSPCLISRIGSVELQTIKEFEQKKVFSPKTRTAIGTNAGVFPQSDEMISKFCTTYIEAIKASDAVGVWYMPYESNIIKKYASKAFLFPLRSIEPYYWTNPWSKVLQGKSVLVIHPFTESIQKQFKKKNLLFKDKQDVLPDFNLKTYKSVQSLNSNPCGFNSWDEALMKMQKDIAEIDFDIAIIGAGAYGLPLGAYIKSNLKKSAVVLGGATQILFGIKGNRWNNFGLYNEHWERPLESETIPNKNNVEGGAYW